MRILGMFPLLQRQWASLRNFRDNILKSARATLEQSHPASTYLSALAFVAFRGTRSL